MDSKDTFLKLRTDIESTWSQIELNDNQYGFQIQKGTKFLKGLTDSKILEYQKALNLEFPEILIDYLSIMNGTDKPTINIYGKSKNNPKYSTQFYSYPRDIELVKKMIHDVYNSFDVNNKLLLQNDISRIFPIFSHRFMMIDSPHHEILSIYYEDGIYWASSLEKLLENEILKINKIDFNNSIDDIKLSERISFWISD